MIGGLANHGKGYAEIQLFEEMRKVRVAPNEITFLGVLLACSHAGLWDEGLKYFDVIRGGYVIEPEFEHYGCLVDLLGRSGCLG
ncbi:hypothetical protein RYX36_008588 [Vicia faba]